MVNFYIKSVMATGKDKTASTVEFRQDQGDQQYPVRHGFKSEAVCG